ncbi:MAG: LPS export ABC transporter permease LptG [Ectothiorhodospiraceae bacterium AqS1]|nr:LPS export ABC transporter permease LptG [Ectothiorhodospiraceae bacterium AqS1]
MKIVDRYVARQVGGSIGLVLAALVALLTVLAFVGDLEDVGRGRFGFVDALEQMLLGLPLRIVLLLPFAVIIGTLAGLGSLAASKELIVIRASGASPLRSVLCVLRACLPLILVAMVIAEAVVPWSERISMAHRDRALGNDAAHDIGIWLQGKDSIIHLRRTVSPSRIEGITIYEIDPERGLQAEISAASARYDKDGGWVLEDIRRKDISLEGIVFSSLDEASRPLAFEPEIVTALSMSPEHLSSLDLVRHIRYLQRNRLDGDRYEIALWSKLVYPFSIIALVVLAVPLVFGRLGGTGVGLRIIVGCLLAIFVHVLSQISAKAGIVYGLSPILSAFAPTLSLLLIGLWLLRRV